MKADRLNLQINLLFCFTIKYVLKVFLELAIHLVVDVVLFKNQALVS